MELTNEFRVAVPATEAWDVLTDVERIAPCMPGAQLQEVDGDEYRGIVKVKVGPITAQYKGAARFEEQDKDAGRVVLVAEGRETRGQGNANATITATLTPDGDGTMVRVVTDLTITGRVAQFGRGVLADVSTKLLGQFVECLERDLLAGTADGESAEAGSGEATETAEEPPATAPTSAAAEESAGEPLREAGGAPRSESNNGPSSTRRVNQPEAAPVDLLDAAGVPVAKRAIPVVAAVLVLLFILRRWRRR